VLKLLQSSNARACAVLERCSASSKVAIPENATVSEELVALMEPFFPDALSQATAEQTFSSSIVSASSLVRWVWFF
jgi:hypothetical protein